MLALVSAGCGRRQGAPESQALSEAQEALPAANPGARPVDLATVATISGVVKLAGAPPRMRAINMRSVPSCAQLHQTPPTTEDVVAGGSGALQNVVVYLKGDFNAYSFPAAATPMEIDQKGCMYVPHVVAVRTGQPVQVRNSDSVTHNSFALASRNGDWNQTQTVGGSPVEHVFTVPEVAVALKCNIHPWMKAYVAVFSHPYSAVTAKDGSFTLADIPPGSYTLIAWQEHYGIVEQPVTLAPRGEQTVTLTFSADE